MTKKEVIEQLKKDMKCIDVPEVWNQVQNKTPNNALLIASDIYIKRKKTPVFYGMVYGCLAIVVSTAVISMLSIYSVNQYNNGYMYFQTEDSLASMPNLNNEIEIKNPNLKFDSDLSKSGNISEQQAIDIALSELKSGKYDDISEYISQFDSEKFEINIEYHQSDAENYFITVNIIPLEEIIEMFPIISVDINLYTGEIIDIRKLIQEK